MKQYYENIVPDTTVFRFIFSVVIFKVSFIIFYLNKAFFIY
jgi:hypothetical protein